MSRAATTGVLRGKTITLDSPVPDLEGLRVRVVLKAAEDPESKLSEAEQARAWEEWAEHGPDGPIEEDEEPEPL